METNSFTLSILDRLRSKRNRLFFALRKQIAFTRQGYSEMESEHTLADWENSFAKPAMATITSLRQKYNFDFLRAKLSLASWQKNLATLWILYQFPELLSDKR